MLRRIQCSAGERPVLFHTHTSPQSTIADVLKRLNGDFKSDQARITVNGFVRSVRKQKHVAFAIIGDGSSLDSLQAVLSPVQAERLAEPYAEAVIF